MTKELTISKVQLLLKKIILNLFMAGLGLRCRVKAFSSCSEQGLSLVARVRLLTVVASLGTEHRL